MSDIKWKTTLYIAMICWGLFAIFVTGIYTIHISTAQSPKIIVGSSCDYAPYTFRNDRGGIAGYDIDVVQNAAILAGDEIEVKCIIRDDLLPALASGEIDIIASGISITDERRKTFDFSVPYATSYGYVITTKNSGLEKRLMVNGKPDSDIWYRLNFGVLANSTHYNWVVANAPDANIVVFDNIENAYTALSYGQIAALFSEPLQGVEFMSRGGNAEKYVFAGEEIVDPKTLGYGIGFAWRKGDPRRDMYDDKIKWLLKSGKLEEISLKYFKVDVSKSLDE